MKALIKRLAWGQKGVTLVEMLIVLAVIGTLSAIVVPNVTGFLGTSKESSYNADGKQLQSALDGWRGTAAVNETTTGGAKKWAAGYPVIKTSGGGTCDDQTPATTGNTCYLDIAELSTGGFLPGADSVQSADIAKNTTATNSPSGSYGWYVDANGLIQSNPTFVVSGGAYP